MISIPSTWEGTTVVTIVISNPKTHINSFPTVRVKSVPTFF